MSEFDRTNVKPTEDARADAINLAQLWTIGQFRKSLHLDQRQWSNLLRPYRVRTAHELRQEEAREVIDLLSTATRMRATMRNVDRSNGVSASANSSRAVTSFPTDRESSTASTIRG